MKQRSLSPVEFSLKTKRTRKQVFLDEMNAVVPWKDLVALIERQVPKSDNGRPPFAVGTLLRIHFMQQWFGLSDEAIEEALYDTPSYRNFVGIDLGCDFVPDESTVLRFRHMLEQHGLAHQIFSLINKQLSDKGLLLKTGTVVDATLIAAPTSTKNKDHQRDQEMSSTKKGNNYHFGMKAHIGVDAQSGLVHSVSMTTAKDHDVTEVANLLHGEEVVVFGDAGYQGAQSHSQEAHVDWQISQKRGKRKAQKHTPWGELNEQIEQLKSTVRAKVEHAFRTLKCQFGYRKTRYKGLLKNTQQLVTLFALGNLFKVRKKLLQESGGNCA